MWKQAHSAYHSDEVIVLADVWFGNEKLVCTTPVDVVVHNLPHHYRIEQEVPDAQVDLMRSIRKGSASIMLHQAPSMIQLTC